jgi:prepilin-type N-terminal cleavage/methylation domain-containing protein
MNCRGFSFAEVMFAIVILGVGLIMVASIFPVACEQARSNADAAAAAVLARDALSTIQNATTADDYVPTDMTQTFNNVWAKVASSAINPVDARYAWVPFFSQRSDGPMQVTVVVVRRWIHDRYVAADTSGDLLPRGVSIGIVRPANGNDRVDISRDPLGYYQSVTTGAFLIIGQGDTNASGKVVRVGQFVSSNADTVSFLLDTNQGLEIADYCSPGTSAAVIGRDLKDPSNPDGGYDGPAQDVAAFTTFLGGR